MTLYQLYENLEKREGRKHGKLIRLNESKEIRSEIEERPNNDPSGMFARLNEGLMWVDRKPGKINEAFEGFGDCVPGSRQFHEMVNRIKASYPAGTRIRINSMEDPYASDYEGKEGIVDHVDDFGQLHGTWGGLAIIPGVDDFSVLSPRL